MFLLANGSPRGAVSGHTSEQKERRRKEKQHRFWKTCKEALSRDTGQWDGDGCRDIREWAHSHGILMQVKPINSRQIFNRKALQPDPRLSRNLSQNPNWLQKVEWINFSLTKLNPPSHLSFPHWVLVDPFLPLLGVSRRSVDAEEDTDVAWLSLPYSEMFSSGCRQSTHWTGELVFKNKKTQPKTWEQHFHTHSWGLLPQSLTLGWIVL